MMRAMVMRSLGALLAATAAPGVAGAQQQCFDKGTLRFVDCPQPAPFVAPAPVAPAPVFYDWRGYYIGGHAGYGELDLSGGYDLDDPEALLGNAVEPSGFVAGGQIGHNWQSGDVVFGVELDGSYADLDDSVTRQTIGDNQTLSAEVNAFGSLRGRVGLAFDTLMPFVTAGVGLVDYEVVIDDVAQTATFSEEETEIAAVIGGGLEWGFLPRWSLRAEALYYYIGEEKRFTEPGDVGSDELVIEDLWTARGAINFRF